jgi:protein-disulfide isomerase
MRPPPRFVAAGLGLTALIAISAIAAVRLAPAQDVPVTQEMLDNDPEAPVAGNPKGDVTIVAFVDYTCPYCKVSAPALTRLIASDPNVRVVYKDWPILSADSGYGAKLALGAKYQGKYEAVHDALMNIHGPVDREKMNEALRATGIDVDLLNQDLDKHFDEIVALIRRNDAQAKQLHLPGTPVYVVGSIKMATALDDDGFKRAVAAARAQAKK